MPSTNYYGCQSPGDWGNSWYTAGAVTKMLCVSLGDTKYIWPPNSGSYAHLHVYLGSSHSYQGYSFSSSNYTYTFTSSVDPNHNHWTWDNIANMQIGVSKGTTTAQSFITFEPSDSSPTPYIYQAGIEVVGKVSSGVLRIDRIRKKVDHST